MLYTCNEAPCPERAQLIQANLKAIGIDVSIRTFPRSVQFTKEGVKGEPFDIADEGLVRRLRRPVELHQQAPGRAHDPGHEQRQLLVLQRPGLQPQDGRGQARSARIATPRSAALDEDLARNAAPLVAWSVPNNIDFVSSRVGCYQFQPVYFMNLATLCLKS